MWQILTGTGYVGLVTAVCLAEKRHSVTCVIIDENKIAMLNSGKTPIFEDGLEELT
jgi:UDPglucose 6-dehydrogenase